jgi:hypothetical protein
MFGNPQWFRAKTVGFGLVPVRWQGWLYTAGWGSAIGLPFLLLIGRHQAVEAMAWMAVSLTGLIYDVWQILQAFRRKPASVAPASVPAPVACAAAAAAQKEVIYIAG